MHIAFCVSTHIHCFLLYLGYINNQKKRLDCLYLKAKYLIFFIIFNSITVPKSKSLFISLHTHTRQAPRKNLQLIIITTHSNISTFITKQWVISKTIVILLRLPVPRETFQVCENDKRLVFLSLKPVSPHSLKTTCFRKYFFLIFFFF